MKIYKETWEDRDGLLLDIAFTQYEMEEMPIEFRVAKRNYVAEEHNFNINSACRIHTLVLVTRECKE